MRFSVLACRNLWRLCMFAVLCMVFAGVALANNSKELKAQAEELLAKSHGLSNIESPGSSPFVLTASVRYTEHGKSGSGEAEIDWLAPDHFRETLLAPGYSYVQVVQDGKQYLSRSDDHVPLLAYELLQTLSTALTPPSFASKTIKKITTRQVLANVALICPETKPHDNSITVCLDSDGDIVNVDDQSPPELSSMDRSYKFSNFAAFGLHRFPLTLAFQGGDGNEIDVTVPRIAPIENASAQHFEVPVGSAQQSWCAQPKVSESTGDFAGVVRPPLQSGIRMPAVTVLYIEVGAGGRPRGANLVHSSEPIKEQDLNKWISEMRFPVLRCGDDAIEYQTEIGIKAPQFPVF